jgi:hypothetical protein
MGCETADTQESKVDSVSSDGLIYPPMNSSGQISSTSGMHGTDAFPALGCW